MKTGKRFSPEIRERSVRMVFDQEREYSSQWACIESIAGKVGCSSQTLKSWVAKAEVELCRRQGVTQSEQDRLKALERENKELRRANEFLRKASAYFAQAELDRRPK